MVVMVFEEVNVAICVPPDQLPPPNQPFQLSVYELVSPPYDTV